VRSADRKELGTADVVGTGCLHAADGDVARVRFGRCRLVTLFVASAATVAGCRTPPMTAGGGGLAAAAETSGVRLSASLSWSGWPSDLEDALTAAEVTIENRSGRAVAVAPAEFALTTPAGERWIALAPRDALRITADFEGAKSPWFLHDRSSSFIPAAPPPGPNPLPSEPEVLPDGGVTTAQLFFGVPARRLKRVELLVTVVTAAGEHVADVRLPFVRE
jgi:hypothetical protein